MKCNYTKIRFKTKSLDRQGMFDRARGYVIERDGDTVIISKGPYVVHKPWADVQDAEPEAERTPLSKARAPRMPARRDTEGDDD